MYLVGLHTFSAYFTWQAYDRLIKVGFDLLTSILYVHFLFFI
jgi:hypothetical protein